jgi:hypothetical protein
VSNKHIHLFIVFVIGLSNLAIDVDLMNLELDPYLNIWNLDKSRAEERKRKDSNLPNHGGASR